MEKLRGRPTLSFVNKGNYSANHIKECPVGLKYNKLS